MPGAAEIHVKGAKELERAFKQLRKEMLAEMRPELRRLANVVRADAESRAFGEITNIGESWGAMRVGVTVKGVYVAPKMKSRGDGDRRPNFAGLLMERAMDPALEANRERIREEFDLLINAASLRARL